MRILITGATGLIGREVGKQLVQLGHEIVVVSRRPESAQRELPFPAQVEKWESEEVAFPQSALKGIDGIIHLAGEPVANGRWNQKRKARIRNSRVLGTRRLVEAITSNSELARRLKFFVLGSATGIYGDRGDEKLSEASTAGSDFLADVVKDWESEVEPLNQFGSETPVRISIVRTGIVLARHGGALEKMLPLFQKGVAGRLGSGTQWMSWIHLEDIARVFVFCATDSRASGVFNGVADDPATNKRFTRVFAHTLGVPAFLPVPGMALKAAFGEMAGALLGGQRVYPVRLGELGFSFHFSTLESALAEILEPLRGGQHEMFAEQWVSSKPDEVFPFFCSEQNLEILTPPFLSFKVIGKSTDKIAEGTLIDYRLSLRGLPLRWRTRIEDWKVGEAFVDTQLKGPYQKWHHTHEFIPFAGGTLMRDRVLYKLPVGWIGNLVAGWRVSRDVSQIFAYRRKKIDELFGRGK